MGAMFVIFSIPALRAYTINTVDRADDDGSVEFFCTWLFKTRDANDTRSIYSNYIKALFLFYSGSDSIKTLIENYAR